jgi:hypothetical protein
MAKKTGGLIKNLPGRFNTTTTTIQKPDFLYVFLHVFKHGEIPQQIF